MKFLTWLILTVSIALGAQVEEQDALIKAMQWKSQQGGARTMSTEPPVLQDEYQLESGNPAFYVIHSDNQLIFVSGDSNGKTILGWTDRDTTYSRDEMFETGFVDVKDLWMDQIEAWQYETNGIPEETLADFAVEDSSDEPVEEVEPLLTTCWGQGTGWNSWCPEDDRNATGHAYVGCVAVAMGQVLYHYKHPWRGKFVVEYTDSDYGLISENFLDHEFRWDEMQTRTATDASAELLYLCAVGVGMDFGPYGSSSTISRTTTASYNYFRYTKQVPQTFWKMGFSEYSWDQMIREQLEAGNPLIYRGQGSRGGHAFNVDGWRSDGYYHINFGWGCSYNGWYSLGAITPGSYDFTAIQGMVIGIEPEAERLVTPRDGDENIDPSEHSFVWLEPTGIKESTVQISTGLAFAPTQIVQETVVPSRGLEKNKMLVKGLEPNTQYYWRVLYTLSDGRKLPPNPVYTCTFETAKKTNIQDLPPFIKDPSWLKPIKPQSLPTEKPSFIKTVQ